MMSLKKTVFSAALLAAGSVFAAGHEAIHLEHPTIWYAFDNPTSIRTSSGSANLTFENDGGEWAFVANGDVGGSHIRCGTGNSACWGSGLAWGTGNWTVYARMKSTTTANRILLGLGSVQSGKHGIVVCTGSGGDQVSFRVVENLINIEQRLDITVPNAAAEYHDYALVFSLEDREVTVYVDGTAKGTFKHPNFVASNTYFQWFGQYGGLGSSGLGFGEGCELDDFRLYQRSLTTDELLLLKRGRQTVPVFGGFLPKTEPLLIWKNTNLKDIYRFRMRTGGTSMGTLKNWSVPFYMTHTANAVDAQMQLVEDGTYNKAITIQLTQQGADVWGIATQAAYVQISGSGGVLGTQGNDFRYNAITVSSVAVGNDTSAYGLHQLTADSLTDEEAAVWTGTTGAFSVASNWKDSSAVTAGRNLSFTTGTGTVHNDLPAGTAFGTLAFGVESGERTIDGNGGSFAEVINASTAAQTFEMPLTYAGDFKPETLGALTFKDLTVNGTFQPVGSGDIQFAGETKIAKADVRYNVRTLDWDPTYPTGSWANQNTGYVSANKMQVYLLRTLPGGHTTIDVLQTNLAGQRRQVTLLEGDFTVGGADLNLGSDAIFAVKNGTTTFAGTYAPGTYGVNAYLAVHEDGHLVIPSFAATTGQFLQIDGVLDMADASTTGNLYLRHNGTFNANRLAGSGAVYVDGVTMGPLDAGLVIMSNLTVEKGNAPVPGVTFRTSLPDGTPSQVSLVGGFAQNAEAPLIVTGSGTFTWSRADALALAMPLTVTAGATADFSMCKSLALNGGVTLDAGATLVVPSANGVPAVSFASKPTLPAEGTAMLVIDSTALQAAGTYTLVETSCTAADLEHLAIAFSGANAGSFSATLTVEDGALKAVVTRAAATGPMTAKLVLAGYDGKTTLANFPVCVKLPTGVPGFSYADAQADGSDVWFSDAAGNRLAQDVDTWNVNGDSIIWVKVPQVEGRNTAIVMHWGSTADIPAAPAANTVWTAGNYVGVWHMNEESGTVADATGNGFTATPMGAATSLTAIPGALGKARTGATGTGSRGYFSIPNYNAKNVGDSFTLSGWFNFTGANGSMRLFSRKNVYTDSNGWEIETSGASYTVLAIRGVANNKSYKPTLPVSMQNVWAFVTFVYNGGTVTVYENGRLVGSGAIDAATDNGLTMSIGCDANGDESFVIGSFDECRLHDEVESADWVRASYLTMARPEEFLVATAVDTLPGAVYDFRSETAPNSVAAATGALPVFAGVETTFALPGAGLLAIDVDKKAVVPSWNGTIKNAGWLTLTGVTAETVSPLSGVTEYAGRHALSFTATTTPIVLSGTVTVSGEYGILQYQNAPVTVTGGTTTLSGIVRIGEQNSDIGYGSNYGAFLTVEKGVFQTDNTGSLDYSGYQTRPMEINVTGTGLFTAKMRAWNTSETLDLTNATVKVGGHGVFAPVELTTRNPATAHSGAMRLYFTVSENGTFVAPADVPNWTVLTAGAGDPSLTGAATTDVEYRGYIDIPADRTLTLRGTAEAKPYFAMNNVITGEGTLAVENAILDMTEDVDTEDFAGGIVVRDGGVIILPAGREPTYPITLEAGARVIATVTEGPAFTAAFMGALAATPNTGRATVEFDMPNSVPMGSVYTITTSNLPGGAADSLDIVFTGKAGETTQGTIALNDEGEVIVTVTESDNPGGELEWRGVEGTTVTTNATVKAWGAKGVASASLFPYYANLMLWFTDEAANTVVPVVDDVKPAGMYFTGTKNYELRGAGKFDTPFVVKEGTGTLVMNGSGFANPTNIVVKSGTLQLGDALKFSALGTTETAITIEDGATLDLNTTLGASADTGRGAAINDQKVIISGEGVSGKGAIYDHNPNNAWQFNLGRVELADDAKIAGTTRIDFRKATNATFAGNPSLQGEGKTLTTDVQVPEDWNQGLNFLSVDANIGKLIVKPNSSIGFEGAGTFKATDGIELQSGARIQYWGSTGSRPAVTVTGADTRLKISSAASTQDGAITIAEGASTRIYGGVNFSATGGLTNDGMLTVEAGTISFTGALAGGAANMFNTTGGSAQYNPSTAAGSFNLMQSGGDTRFGSTADWSAVPMTITSTAGVLYWGMGQGTGFPNVQDANLNLSGFTGGDIVFDTGKSDTISSAFTAAKPGNVYIRTASPDQEITLAPGNYELTATLRVSNAGSNYGKLVIPNGASLKIAAGYVGCGGSSAKAGVIDIREGGSLEATGTFWVGEWSGASNERHEVIVNGGTFTHLNTDRVRMGWDSPHAFFTLNAGTANIYGFCCRKSWTDPNSFDELVQVNGGVLNLGAGGLCAWTKFKPFVQFNNGTVNCTADWVVEQLRAVGFGDRAGGLVHFNLNGKTIDWRTGLTGLADVSLEGNGTFKSGVGTADKLRFQGVTSGKWTIANLGQNTLYGASAFAGGLHLQEDVLASIRIGGSNLVEAVYFQTGDNTFATACTYSNAYPFACNDLTTLQGKSGSADYSTANILWQGQFYVDTPGKWTFAGGYDDSLRIDIDGQAVVNNATWNAVMAGTTAEELAVGWHDFRIVQFQSGGGWGTPAAGWADVMNVGFQKSPISNTDAGNFIKFDGDHLPLRAAPVTSLGGGELNWSSVKGFDANTWNTRTDLTPNGTAKLSPLHTYNLALTPTLGGSTHQFDGWIYVRREQAGDWSVYLDYDDRASLEIDGVDSGAVGETKATGTNLKGITTGWHAFRLRVADNTGSWGPWSDGGKYGAVTVNGTEYRLDETAFLFSAVKPTVWAGLYGVTELEDGAVLDNVAQKSCPIWGTVKGNGTLQGLFAFTGDDACWEVSGNGKRRVVENQVKFESGDPNAFADLKKVKAVFTEKPTCATFDVGPALGADATKLVVDVKDVDGNDYSEGFTAVTAGGRLLLKNAHPAGFTLILR